MITKCPNCKGDLASGGFCHTCNAYIVHNEASISIDSPQIIELLKSIEDKLDTLVRIANTDPKERGYE